MAAPLGMTRMRTRAHIHTRAHSVSVPSGKHTLPYMCCYAGQFMDQVLKVRSVMVSQCFACCCRSMNASRQQIGCMRTASCRLLVDGRAAARACFMFVRGSLSAILLASQGMCISAARLQAALGSPSSRLHAASWSPNVTRLHGGRVRPDGPDATRARSSHTHARALPACREKECLPRHALRPTYTTPPWTRRSFALCWWTPTRGMPFAADMTLGRGPCCRALTACHQPPPR